MKEENWRGGDSYQTHVLKFLAALQFSFLPGHNSMPKYIK
jgi:hypothetical protein